MGGCLLCFLSPWILLVPVNHGVRVLEGWDRCCGFLNYDPGHIRTPRSPASSGCCGTVYGASTQGLFLFSLIFLFVCLFVVFWFLFFF